MVYLITFYANVYYENIRMNQIEAVLLDKNVPTKRIDLRNDSLIGKDLLEDINIAKLVCISPAWINSSIDLGRRIKELYPKIIVTFEYPTQDDTYLEIINDNGFIDFISLGHAGYSIYEFLEGYDGRNEDELIKKSQHLISKKYQSDKSFRTCDINDIPWKKHNEGFIDKYLFTHLDTSIGCTADCSFCGSVREKWSGRSPEDIVQEIQRLESVYNIRAFNFTDKSIEDPVNRGGKKRFETLCDLLIETKRRYAFSAYIRAESFKDTPEDIALLMKARSAGFVEFVIGIEAGNEKDLCLYNKRATLKDNKEILSLLPKVKINPFYGFIMLNPYSTRETLKANYEFLTEYKCYIPGNYIFFLMLDRSVPILKKLDSDNLITRKGYHEVRYKAIDSFIEAILKYVNDTYLKTGLFDDIVKMQDQFRILDMMTVLIDNVEDLLLEYKLLKAELAQMLSEYYSTLYIKGDIDQMYKTFEWYYHILKNDYIFRFTKIILIFYKRYCRQYNFNKLAHIR